MTADKLNQLRSKVKRGELLDRDQQLAVIDHGLGSLVEIAGGSSTLDRRKALDERERQVGLALDDLREVLTLNPRTPRPRVDAQRALFIVDMMKQMLKAKGPAWQREWSWYQPRVEEEFEE